MGATFGNPAPVSKPQVDGAADLFAGLRHIVSVGDAFAVDAAAEAGAIGLQPEFPSHRAGSLAVTRFNNLSIDSMRG
jgi:hypothetical protein